MVEKVIPRATYRLQLHKDFTFAAAADLASYLASLGISHAYLSPVLKARAGSLHGYDTVDHTVLNPELGTRADFERMVEAFKRHGLGVLLDIVPNHMGVGGSENALWLDVLKHGRQSRYADWFDINWSPAESSLQGKILVPFLGTSMAEALDRSAFELKYDDTEGAFSIWMEKSHKLPLNPSTTAMIGGPDGVPRFNLPSGRDELVRLMDGQCWLPARYSTASDDINYRRFFIVSDLAGIRVERDDVFDHVHKLTFDLVKESLVDGLRVDHIDGLYDPKAYALKLREACPRPIYLVVEKILAGHETLRADWGVDGTTGYEFATAVTRLMTDSLSEDALSRFYKQYTGQDTDFDTLERSAKLSIIDFEMSAELDALATSLRTIAVKSLKTRDLTRTSLRSALREVVASMPVYRTYVDDGKTTERDLRYIDAALATAMRAAPLIYPAVFDFIAAVMRGYGPEGTRDVARRIQQYTGPVTAKGLEDTALYRYNRLISLSDVGQKPDLFATQVAAFHSWCAARAESVPTGLLATTTHDSKRGEDTRARITALSGYVDDWIAAVPRWDSLLGAELTRMVDPNDRYNLYQLLVGAWPAAFSPDRAPEPQTLQGFRERVDAAMLKSVREARLHTAWTVSQPDYEAAVSQLVNSALNNSAFISEIQQFDAKIGGAGAANGLVETVLKLTVPGVPDFYQGAELWEQSMVDPDNRRPVDFDARRGHLASEAPHDLEDGWRSGAVKQHMVKSLLALRAEYPALFEHGSYEPLASDLPEGCAFIRRHGKLGLVVAVHLAPWRGFDQNKEFARLPPDLANLRRQDLTMGKIFDELPAQVFLIS